MDNQKDAFYEIARAYFQSMRIMRSKEAWDNILDGLFHNVSSSGNFFYMPYDPNTELLVSPIADWQTFVLQTQELFGNKISIRKLNAAVSENIVTLESFPFSDDLISQYINNLQAWIDRQVYSAFIALVPVYNLRLEGAFKEITLANSTLCKGSNNSLLALLGTQEKVKSLITFDPALNFLAIPVSGDQEAITNTVRIEANRSLALLRFISHWSQRAEGLNYRVENEAAKVTLSPTEISQFVYYDPKIDNELRGMATLVGRALYFIMKNEFEYLKDIYELDNLNYHFQSELNPVSSRIIRALELYDSGVHADTHWQALYRFVASIDTVLFLTNGDTKEMKLRFQKLIKFGGNYVGSIDEFNNVDEKPTSHSWEELSGKLADLFEGLYISRGQIIHGDVVEPTLEDFNKVRVLANNGIRLIAKLAREFNWITRSNVKAWFKNPEYPPSIRDSVRGIEPD